MGTSIENTSNKGEAAVQAGSIAPLFGTPLDYANKDNWLRFDTKPAQDTDLLYLYPTLPETNADENGFAIIDAAFRASAEVQYATQATAFESYTNVFSPLIRQAGLMLVLQNAMVNKSMKPFVDVLRNNLPRTDLYAALDYYFENANNGRPFIIAGHSQGSTMIAILLSEYMKAHPDYLKRMVAAYAIGVDFDREWLEKNPHLKYAQGETDTGCIISWNTEGPDAEMPNLLLAEKDPYCINPLNWKTDDTYADASLNIGSLLNGKIVPGFADAQINPVRGAVVCTTCQEYIPLELSPIFGTKSLHGADNILYYENLKENGKKRICAFFQKNGK